MKNDKLKAALVAAKNAVKEAREEIETDKILYEDLDSMELRLEEIIEQLN